MQQLNKSAHSTHTLNFHLIFCTKYRRTVLTTAGGAPLETLKTYVENQRTK